MVESLQWYIDAMRLTSSYTEAAMNRSSVIHNSRASRSNTTVVEHSGHVPDTSACRVGANRASAVSTIRATRDVTRPRVHDRSSESRGKSHARLETTSATV